MLPIRPTKIRRLDNPDTSRLGLKKTNGPDASRLLIPKKIKGSLQELPGEIISVIATFLEATGSPDLRLLMQTCRHVCYAAEYHRYMSIVAFGEIGTKLMGTLLSGSMTAQRYCKRVKRLWFRGWDDDDILLNSVLLSQTLPLLENLTSLWLEVNPDDPTHFRQCLTRTGVIRDSIHPAACIADIISNHKNWSRLTLPRLRAMRLTGDPWIVHLTRHRALKELELNSLFQLKEFPELIKAVEGSILQHSLETLCIRIGRCVDTKLAFPMIATAFPSLRRLSLEQTSIEFESILEQLAFDNTTLPWLKAMAVNRRFSHAIVVSGIALPKLFPIVDVMEEYLSRISRSRPYFETIGMGKVVWTRGMNGRFMRKDVGSHPDYWYLDFGEPFRQGRFDFNQLPPFSIQISDH